MKLRSDLPAWMIEQPGDATHSACCLLAVIQSSAVVADGDHDEARMQGVQILSRLASNLLAFDRQQLDSLSDVADGHDQIC